ncbi:aldo/keto reductase [Streptomyces sulphureus]|uniref:aldo/keto reductase n=1 Tax=Streptomyces sulphureus TaxID=47758 RepID=UPI000377F4E8|nr:aldo/keto reductase [Streptomyces sulphureus]
MSDHTSTSMHSRYAVGSLSVAPFCLGGNVFGWTADEATSFAVLDAHAEAGGNFVDTADGYTSFVEGNSGGESETIIGEWMKRRGNRDDVVLATKVGTLEGREGLRPANIRAACEDSLRRLQADHIDLYYTHRDDETVTVPEIVDTLDALVREGKVREVAASNLSASRLRESLAYAQDGGKAAYVAVQPHYNLVSRETYEGELQDTAAESGLASFPYFALASGFLTGKYRPGDEPSTTRGSLAAQYLGSERGQRVLAALAEVAEAHGVSGAGVALAWLRTRATVVAPIASARTPEQLPGLLEAAGVELTGEEVERLEKASR